MRSLLAALLTLSSLAVAAPCAELPVLFVVQDKSGSMAKAPDGSTATTTSPSKWSIAQQVVPTLAQQFSNRFRFGVEMYPRDTSQFNCSTGTVLSNISTSPNGVASAYGSALPGGGTPTAASLQTARTYLLSQALTTPSYVLLITDGLPNCNTSLDADTCSATTPGCGPTPNQSACALGSKDCLDSNATVVAAQQLFAAGIKVFVVGFDSTLIAGNNKAVLDAIAAAGGSSSAYTATNQAQLQSVLNTIASSTSTCCLDACTNGAAQCTGAGSRQVCQVDTSLGCTAWVPQTCASGSTCANGTCQQCNNSCTAGAVRCGSSGNAEQCVANAQGCTAWQTADTCSYGELCANGMCNSCAACSPGASRCTATGVETCELSVFSGCTSWRATSCPSGSICSNGACSSCNSTCSAGAKRCAGNTAQTCVADTAGCTTWQSGQVCTDFCSGGECGTCGTSCAIGQTRCQGSGVETCVTDANSCPSWGAAQQCAANSFCANGTCAMCATSCTQGARRCAANGVTETCTLEATGCTGWGPSGQCDLGAGERCADGMCLPPCMNPCEDGATQCSNGGPQSCHQQASGCFAWQDEAACGVAETCTEGGCHGPCMGEFEECPEGQLCRASVDGRSCFIDVNDAGTGADGGSQPPLDAGVESGSGGGSGTTGVVDAGSGSGGSGKTGITAGAAGCSCQVLDVAGLLPFLGLGVMLRLRRRKS